MGRGKVPKTAKGIAMDIAVELTRAILFGAEVSKATKLVWQWDSAADEPSPRKCLTDEDFQESMIKLLQ